MLILLTPTSLFTFTLCDKLFSVLLVNSIKKRSLIFPNDMTTAKTSNKIVKFRKRRRLATFE